MSKIVYDRENCIGAAACVAAAAKFWELANDGKADLKGSKKTESEKFELEIKNKKDVDMNKEAADVCPVNVIVIEE
jgi:ferredoxin